MIKKLAWNTFKNTGNINTFLELIELENTEKSLFNASSSSNDFKKSDSNGANIAELKTKL